MRVFFNAIVVQIFLSLYVLWRGCQAVPPKKQYRLSLIVFFLIEIIIYFIGFFFSKHLPFEKVHLLAWIGTTWMVFILYTSGLLIPFDILRYIVRKKNILSSFRIRSFYFWSSIVIVISIMFWGNYKFKNPEVNHIRIQIEKQTELDSLRVVVVTDIHAGYLIKKDILKKYVDLIMKQKPDLILLVGDVIDFDLASVEKQNMQEEFRSLHAPYGVYISTGNHEYIGLADEAPFAKIKWLADSTNSILLRDSAALIDNKFYIVGREDDTYMCRRDLTTLMSCVDTKLPVILMNHEPTDIHEASKNGIDIAFYGHTHNGQIFPANLLLKLLWELPYGYKQIGESHVYVSSGLGLAGPQYRIGTVSEILVCDIIFKKNLEKTKK